MENWLKIIPGQKDRFTSLSGGSRRGVNLPGSTSTALLPALFTKAVGVPFWGSDVGGTIGGIVGGKAIGMLHGGGREGEEKRLSGELGQILAEVEKNMGTPMTDVRNYLSQALQSGFGEAPTSEFGTGYQQQISRT